jgi:hypothetical protein
VLPEGSNTFEDCSQEVVGSEKLSIISKLADQADHRLTKSSLPLRQASYVIGVRSITCVTLPIITLTSGRRSRGDRTPLPRDR